MPMDYTDAKVLQELKMFELPVSDDSNTNRETLAAYLEKSGELIGAHEARTATPWTDWTKEQTQDLYIKFPDLWIRNPGFCHMMRKHGLLPGRP